MARRKHHHEEHLNHEAWAIPYGDLITLLLAFFVVMYAISSLNEGKYRVVADSLAAAFGGVPRTMKPVQMGQHQLRGGGFDHPSVVEAAAKHGPAAPTLLEVPMPLNRDSSQAAGKKLPDTQLHQLGKKIEQAMNTLVKQGLVKVRRGSNYLEVEIQSDLLFASGVAKPTALALNTIHQLAAVLRDVPNAVRVEGYTDNQPISNALFRSNWDLSAARATNVVYELIDQGLAPHRLASMGYGEYQPIADNTTSAGRSANRRVDLVILAASENVSDILDGRDTQAAAPLQPVATLDLASAGIAAGGMHNQAQAKGAP